jgi:hypothetical protein
LVVQYLVDNLYRMYYQHSPERLSTCPVTIHALLHIADYIKAVGPVWVSWAFPMERFCGLLQPSIKSRRFPYSSIDKYVVNAARLSQCKIIYSVVDELSLTRRRGAGIQGQFSSDECMFYLISNLILTYHIYQTPPVSYYHHDAHHNPALGCSTRL